MQVTWLRSMPLPFAPCQVLHPLSPLNPCCQGLSCIGLSLSQPASSVGPCSPVQAERFAIEVVPTGDDSPDIKKRRPTWDIPSTNGPPREAFMQGYRCLVFTVCCAVHAGAPEGACARRCASWRGWGVR